MDSAGGKLCCCESCRWRRERLADGSGQYESGVGGRWQCKVMNSAWVAGSSVRYVSNMDGRWSITSAHLP